MRPAALHYAGLDDPVYGPAIRAFPIPLGGFGTPQQIAAAVAFLLGPDSAFFCATGRMRSSQANGQDSSETTSSNRPR